MPENPISAAVSALFGSRKVPPQVRAQELRSRAESLEAEAATLADEIREAEAALVASQISGRSDTKKATAIAALRAREQGLALAKAELEEAARQADAAHAEEIRVASAKADKALVRRRSAALSEAYALAAEARRLSQRWGGGLHIHGFPLEISEALEAEGAAPLPCPRPWYELCHDEGALLSVDAAESQKAQKAIRRALTVDMGDDTEPARVEALRQKNLEREAAEREQARVDHREALVALAALPWTADDVLRNPDSLHSLRYQCEEHGIPHEGLRRELVRAAQIDPSLTWSRVNPVSALAGVEPAAKQKTAEAVEVEA